MANTVLVSGGSGYIAGFLVRQLVAKGWTVHATVRDLARESALRKHLAVDDSRLKFFAADLGGDAGWGEAMAGCSHAVHVASPLPAGAVRNADEVIGPARDGALRALRAAKAAGVRRFVMTSSVAAISYGRGKGTHRFTEADWTDPDSPGASAYVRSKTIAERAARAWVANEGGGIEYCTVNPAFVIGPVLSSDYSPSILLVKRMLDGSLPACPDIGFSLVDVRDVADMHLRVLEAPGMAGERFIASGPFVKLTAIADILRARLGEAARRAPTRKAPDFLVRIVALFDSQVRAVVDQLGTVSHMDASHAQAVLGWAPRPVEESIVDTARSLIELGIVRG